MLMKISKIKVKESEIEKNNNLGCGGTKQVNEINRINSDSFLDFIIS